MKRVPPWVSVVLGLVLAGSILAAGPRVGERADPGFLETQVPVQAPPPAGRGGPQRLAPQPLVTTGLVMGKVVDAATGRPVAGATVTLNGGAPQTSVQVAPGTPRPTTNTSPPPPPRMMTDAEGRFAFRHLTRGSYSLIVNKPGYADGAYGRLRPNGPTRQLVLLDNERLGDITIRVFKFGSIAGSVFDEAGEPIIGAQVRAYRRTLVAGRRVLTQGMSSAQTDDRGFYRFGMLTPGEYVIAVPMVQTTVPAGFMLDGARSQNFELTMNSPSGGGISASPGNRQVTPDGRFLLQMASSINAAMPVVADANGRLMTYATQYYSAASTVAQAQPVAIASGEERNGIDMVMGFVPTSSISGQLIAPDGNAASYVLRLVPSDTGEMMNDPEVATAITDQSGYFMFIGVPAGQYVLQTVRMGRMAVQVEAARTTALAQMGLAAPASVERTTMLAQTQWASLPISLGGEDVHGLTLALRDGLKVSGRVEFSGSAERPNAQRLAQVPVLVESADGRPRNIGAQPPSRIEPDGRFTVQGLLPGKYLLRIGGSPPGWFMQSAVLNGIDIADVPFDLADADASGVIVTFTDRPANLSGTARVPPDADSAAVIIFPSDASSWKSFGLNPRRMRMTRASTTGNFGFGSMPAGDYYVVAIREEFSSEWQDPKYLELLAGAATRVSLGEGERRTIDLQVQDVRPPGGGDAPSLAPQAPSPVPQSPEAPSPEPHVSSSKLPTPEAAGASGPFVPDEPEQQVRDTRPTAPVGPSSISGVVLHDDESGRPVRGARVSARSPESRVERVGITDEQGRFSINWLPQGQYTVVISKPGYISVYYGARRAGRPPGTPVVIESGKSVSNLVARMPRGGVITGTVFDHFGQPLPNARLRLLQWVTRNGERVLQGSGGYGQMTTDDRGVYRIYGVTPGSYVVSVIPPNTGGSSEIRLLSDDEMRAAMADLERKDPIPQTPPPPAGQGVTMGVGLEPPGRAIAPAPPGPLPERPPSGSPVGFSEMYYPGTAIDQEATAITVAAGQELTSIDIAARLVPTARIEGSVVGLDTQSPQRAQVLLMKFTLNSSSSTSVRMLDQTRFMVMGVPPGRYSLVARLMEQPQRPAPGAPGAPMVITQPPGLQQWAMQEVVVNGEDITGVTLVLQDGLSVSGRVVFQGKTPPPDDLTKVRVSLENIGINRIGNLARPVQTDAQGNFVLRGVTPGTYRLNASVPSPTPAQPWIVKSAMVEGRETFDTPIDIQPGRNVAGAVVTLTDQMTELSGTITNSAGAPVTDVMVLLFPTDRDLWVTSSRRMRPPTRPGADGKFRFQGLIPGEYFFAVVTDLEPSDWGDPSFMEQVAAASIKLTFTEGEKKVQDIRAGTPGTSR